MMAVLTQNFNKYGLDLPVVTNVIPNDNTTLFVCSGMQNLKPRFAAKDGGRLGNIQWCVRTNDLDLIGDGSHLTSFQMIGNFSFGNNDYHTSVLMWDEIVKSLGLKDSIKIHIHPESNHETLWTALGYEVVYDQECKWSDGNIGGFCCELYHNGLEIGNLVNTLEHSTDVGFGLERLLQVVEGKPRVDETSLFDLSLPPVVRDHVRTLRLLKANGVTPGAKGRLGVCRRLARKCLDSDLPEFKDWIDTETKVLIEQSKLVKRVWVKHKDKSPQWWFETYGVDIDQVKAICVPT